MATAESTEPLLVVDDVVKRYDEDIVVLDHVRLDIRAGEFVALLGPSGSGKSTLLRIITGLLPPSGGRVLYRGAPVQGPNPRAAMVFQTFALYPWLTVLDNVEIGLKAHGLPAHARREKALRLIDLIGLDGYEDAYPKELSGGMRQRVGFARALAVEPELLCMDEPFSALDFLTAENLRSELLDLWRERRIPTRAILMVTHGIEEAAFMADRIVVLSKSPARLVADLRVPLGQPRNRKSADFLAFVDRVYEVVTEGADALATPVPAMASPRFPRLPPAPIGMFSGLLELLADRGGQDDLSHLGSELMMEVDDLLPVTDAAELLGMAEVREGDLLLTPLGEEFAAAEGDARKALFARQIAELPVIALIRRVLYSKRSKTMPKEFFADLLQEHFAAEGAVRQLDIAITWGRYAELFYYDPEAEELYLEEPAEPGTAPADATGQGGERRPELEPLTATAGEDADQAREQTGQSDDAED